MYSELDNIAWELFPKTGLTQNKSFFVYYKTHYPYSMYYEKAKISLRKDKIKKLQNNLVDSKKELIFVV